MQGLLPLLFRVPRRDRRRVHTNSLLPSPWYDTGGSVYASSTIIINSPKLPTTALHHAAAVQHLQGLCHDSLHPHEPARPSAIAGQRGKIRFTTLPMRLTCVNVPHGVKSYQMRAPFRIRGTGRIDKASQRISSAVEEATLPYRDMTCSSFSDAPNGSMHLADSS
jgi:hypothetical protein